MPQSRKGKSGRGGTVKSRRAPSRAGRSRAAPSRRDAMILENEGIAVTIAMRMAHRTLLSFDDLLSEARIGLINAVDGFNPARGFRFSTFAWRCVRNQLGRFVNKQIAVANHEDTEFFENTHAPAVSPGPEAPCGIDLSMLREERTRYVITERFGLGGRQPRTLEDVGRSLRLNKERVRQIQNAGLAALRESKAIRRRWEEDAA
jgi:RNA polymerase primary sigma factor